MGFKYGSQELVDEILRMQDEDPEIQAKLKGLSFNLILVGTDAPGGVDWQYAISLDKGRFTNVNVDTQPVPSDLRGAAFDKERFDAKVISDHDTLYRLVTGRSDVMDVIQKVKVVGDFGKFMTQLKGFTSFIEFLSTIDIDL